MNPFPSRRPSRTWCTWTWPPPRPRIRRPRSIGSSVGAVPADIGQGDVPWQVLADPEGNEFCVLDPRPVYRDTGPVAAIVCDRADPGAVADFWTPATGWVRATSTDSGVSFRSPEGVGPYLELLPSRDAKSAKNRIHLDVAPYRGEDHAAAVKTLLEAGAAPAEVGQGGGVSWTVLADPEGGEFCGGSGAASGRASVRTSSPPGVTASRR